jgi:hypothetical protein
MIQKQPTDPPPSFVDSSQRQAQILRFWKAVELFSPQKIPRLNPNSKESPVIRMSGQMPLPWDTPERFPAPEKDHTWRFTAYCGIYKLSSVRQILEERFGKDPSNFDRRSNGESCLFSVQISGDGRPFLDTFVLSSCCWATGRSISPRPVDLGWLEGFDDTLKEEALSFAEGFALLENDEAGRELNKRPGIRVGRPIQPGDLTGEVQRIAGDLQIAHALHPQQVYLKGRQISDKYAYDVEPDDFLNSFFVRDLGRLVDEAVHSNISRALSTYLTEDSELKTEERIDVRQSLDNVWINTSPRQVPSGRWPAPSTQRLYFSQQFAVNAALDELKKGSSLLGVNGPPGTGKTTLLRDLIATVLVERAQVLATLRSPDSAFCGTPGGWQTDGFKRCIHPWRADLLGFGIVVASSNNRAVENVTLEIPAKQAIADEHIAEINYFADFATRLLKKEEHSESLPSKGDAWGLICARLGKKANRRKFVSNFWHADKQKPEPRSRSDQGFLAYLKGVKAKSNTWKTAVDRFQTALKDVERLRAERVESWAAIDKLAKCAEIEASIRANLTNAETLASNNLDVLAQIEELRLASEKEVHEAKQARLEHLAFKPRLIDAIFTLGAAYYKWRDIDASLASNVYTLQARHVSIQRRSKQCAEELAASQNSTAKLAAALQDQENQTAEQDRIVESHRGKLCDAFPETEKWLADPQARELSSPWTDEAWNRARTKVLIESLHLHRAFIEGAPRKIYKNLLGAIDILDGKVSRDVPAETLQSAWATLFFVVPVISTTFASFDRLFAHCGRESIGWLLIDEAGQAVPQHAAGALWRSKKVLVVGDPRQLEPIVTLPFTAQQALRTHFGVEETWLPSRNSVQTLTDRVSRLGTWIHSENADEPIWVGLPLRVHRRCENPMFRLSNQIAYNGQMVYDTQECTTPAPSSTWINVRSGESDEHWIPSEGLALEMLLQDLFNLGVKPSEILLISPFNTVARKLKEIAKRRGIKQAGTIHVSQGKECDIVVLVLGGDPRLPGAKEWASEKPNLLNVAASRAKRRLYIIGDQEEWSQYPFFSDAVALFQSKEESNTKAHDKPFRAHLKRGVSAGTAVQNRRRPSLEQLTGPHPLFRAKRSFVQNRASRRCCSKEDKLTTLNPAVPPCQLKYCAARLHIFCNAPT